MQQLKNCVQSGQLWQLISPQIFTHISAKFLTELSKDPNNLKELKLIIKEKKAKHLLQVFAKKKVGIKKLS